MNIKLAAISVLLTLRAVAQSTPEIVWQTNAHAAVIRSVSFSPEGTVFASGADDGTAKVWSVTNRALLQTVSRDSVHMLSVALYPPSDLLLTGSDDGSVRGWSISSGNLAYGSPPSEDFVWSVAIAADGAVAVGKANGGIDLTSRNGEFELDHGGIQFFREVLSLAFSRNSSKLASSGADGTAKIWRVSDGALLYILTGHSICDPDGEDCDLRNQVFDVDFSSDGMLLASVGADSTARLWSVADGSEVRVINCPGCRSVNFSADGKILLTVNGAIQVWHVATGQLLYNYTDANAGPLDVASNGQYFAYGRGDGAIVLARMPLVLEQSREDGRIMLNWTGGSDLYRIQRRNDLDRGVWHNFGPPTTATSFTNEITRKPVFYRVISLPGAP